MPSKLLDELELQAAEHGTRALLIHISTEQVCTGHGICSSQTSQSAVLELGLLCCAGVRWLQVKLAGGGGGQPCERLWQVQAGG